MFREIEGTWQQVAKLRPNDNEFGDQFGFSVSINGNEAVIGAIGDDDDRGSAYIFREVNGIWQQVSRISSTSAMPFDYFGYDVALDDSNAFVGAYGTANLTGAAHVFDLSEDCNSNGIPDSCDLNSGASQDCDEDGIPDACQPDSDSDGIPDVCDLCPGFDDVIDTDDDGVPDACDACPLIASGETNGQPSIGFDDLTLFVAALLDPYSVSADQRCASDISLDGQVDGRDIQGFLDLVIQP